MKLSVFKDQKCCFLGDLSKEIEGITPFDTLTLYVGRSPDSYLVLDHMQVSREQAKLTFKDGDWHIKFLSKYENCLINGVNVESKIIENGDSVYIGPYIINFESDIGDLKHTKEVTVPMPSTAKASDDENKSVTIIPPVPISVNSPSLATETFYQQPKLDKNEDKQDKQEKQSDGDRTPIVSTDKISSGVAETIETLEHGTNIKILEDEIEKDRSDAFFQVEEKKETENDFGSSFENGSFNDEYPAVNSDSLSSSGLGNAMANDVNESTIVAGSFVKFELEIFGEYAPYDKFSMDNFSEVTIGRDADRCQIVLQDPEVSGVHAKIVKNKISCRLHDLESINGTILNGQRVNEGELNNGDEFVIGNTTFTVHVYSDFIKREEHRLMPVSENQVVEVEEIVEVHDDGLSDINEIEMPNASSSKIPFYKDPLKKRILIWGILGVVLVFVMLPSSDNKKKDSKKNNKSTERLLEGENKNDVDNKVADKKNLTPEQLEILETHYLLAKAHLENQRYKEAKYELDRVALIDSNYKNSKELMQLTRDSIARLEEIAKKEQEEVERKERQEKVKLMVEDAKQAVKERKRTYAEALFSKILELDPENFDVPLLQNELQDWIKEEEKLEVEKAAKEAEYKRSIDMLMPAKNYFLRQEWYQAILKLDDFFSHKDVDQEVFKEATAMYEEAKQKLKDIEDPLVGKARSLKEGEDLKGAYEAYSEILKINPANMEALNEMNTIRITITNRAKKIYREALVSESLSMFNDAREKFKEVQQISPTDNEYYKKATLKLKNYLE